MPPLAPCPHSSKKGGGLSVTKPAHKLDLRKTLTKLDAEYASEDMREVNHHPPPRLAHTPALWLFLPEEEGGGKATTRF